MPDESNIAVGNVYTFKLANGLHGACRVIRTPRVGEDGFAGHVLVCATRWIGRPEDALASADTKKILKSISGLALYWIAGMPPGEFTLAGVIPASKADLAKDCHSSAPWEIFPNVVYATWRREHESETALAGEKAAIERESQRLQREELERLAQRERIDLTGVVPLAKPMTEREPLDVLRGFIAAMNRWETESARITKATGSHVLVQFNQAALQVIFDEFCTNKDRRNGRLGSCSEPPEYDPDREEIVSVNKVGPRRVEIETRQLAGFEQEVRYVLLKTESGWRIDGKKVNGRNGAL